jgi:hypothetical protein
MPFGALAQSVEQGTENPCVRSSILRGATLKPRFLIGVFLFKTSVSVPMGREFSEACCSEVCVDDGGCLLELCAHIVRCNCLIHLIVFKIALFSNKTNLYSKI